MHLIDYSFHLTPSSPHRLVINPCGNLLTPFPIAIAQKVASEVEAEEGVAESPLVFALW